MADQTSTPAPASTPAPTPEVSTPAPASTPAPTPEASTPAPTPEVSTPAPAPTPEASTPAPAEPKVGDIVLYKLADGSQFPAIITRANGNALDLIVFKEHSFPAWTVQAGSVAFTYQLRD